VSGQDKTQRKRRGHNPRVDHGGIAVAPVTSRIDRVLEVGEAKPTQLLGQLSHHIRISLQRKKEKTPAVVGHDGIHTTTYYGPCVALWYFSCVSRMRIHRYACGGFRTQAHGWKCHTRYPQVFCLAPFLGLPRGHRATTSGSSAVGGGSCIQPPFPLRRLFSAPHRERL